MYMKCNMYELYVRVCARVHVRLCVSCMLWTSFMHAVDIIQHVVCR